MTSAQQHSNSITSQAVTWLDRVMLASIHLLILTTPFIFTWVNDELFEFNKMLFTYVLVTIGVSAFAVKSILQGKWLVKRTIFDIPLLLFVASQAISTFFSIHPYTSLWGYYSRFNGGFISIVAYTALYYLVVHAVQRKHVAALCISLVVGLLGSSLYAFPEHFGFSPSCVLISGELNASCWKQDVQHRVFGTFGQPNWLAAYIVTLLPLTLTLPFVIQKFWLKKSLEKVFKISAVAATVLAYPTLLFTKSRSGFLGFAVAMALTFIGFSILALTQKQIRASLFSRFKKTTEYAIGLIVFISMTSLIFGTPYTPPFSEIVDSFSKNQAVESSQKENAPESTLVNRLDVGGTDSGEIRKIVWDGAIAVWKRYPLFGSGVETFAYSYYLDRPMAHNQVSEWDFLYNKAHNELLNFAATTGTIGLVTYVLIFVWFGFRVAWYILRSNQAQTRIDGYDEYLETSLLLTALAAGLVGLSVSNFFGFSTVMVMILMYIYLALTHILITQEKQVLPVATKPIPQKTVPLSLIQNLLIGLTVITTLWVLLSITNRWQSDRLYTEGKNLAGSGQLQQSIPLLTRAIILQPREALFYDELANVYSRLAYAYATQLQDESAEINEDSLQQQEAQVNGLVQAAIDASDTTLALNPVHLNFYKTRARVFLLLSDFNPEYLQDAFAALEVASHRAPTDPKLVYNLGLVALAQGKTDQGTLLIEQSVDMKPNYEAARMKLAEIYTSTDQIQKAIDQYEFVLQNIAPENEIARESLEKIEAPLPDEVE